MGWLGTWLSRHRRTQQLRGSAWQHTWRCPTAALHSTQVEFNNSEQEGWSSISWTAHKRHDSRGGAWMMSLILALRAAGCCSGAREQHTAQR